MKKSQKLETWQKRRNWTFLDQTVLAEDLTELFNC